MLRPLPTYHLLVVLVVLAVTNVPAGAQGTMILSNTDPGLAINAWGGAQHGTVLRLHNGCRPNLPDCTWSR